MHIAARNCDLLAFQVVFGLKEFPSLLACTASPAQAAWGPKSVEKRIMHVHPKQLILPLGVFKIMNLLELFDFKPKNSSLARNIFS